MITCRIFREYASLNANQDLTDPSFPSTWPAYAPARKVGEITHIPSHLIMLQACELARELRGGS